MKSYMWSWIFRSWWNLSISAHFPIYFYCYVSKFLIYNLLTLKHSEFLAYLFHLYMIINIFPIYMNPFIHILATFNQRESKSIFHGLIYRLIFLLHICASYCSWMINMPSLPLIYPSLMILFYISNFNSQELEFFPIFLSVENINIFI